MFEGGAGPKRDELAMFLRTLIAVTATAGLIATLGSAPSPAVGPAAPEVPAAQLAKAPSQKLAPITNKDAYTNRLVIAMNDVRRKHHLRALRTRPCVGTYASRWAAYLARTGKFEHQSLTPILRTCGLSRVGEILAKGNVRPRYMITMWLHSPGHRALLLDRRFRIAGVSARRDSTGAWVGCIDFGRG